VRDDVIAAVGHVARPERVGRAHAGERDEVDLLHARVRVAPRAADERDALLGLQVDDRVGPPREELGRPGKPGGDGERLGRGHR
jgi:hypothetical protein